MPAALPSLTQLKTHLGISSASTGRDARLEQIAAGVEAWIRKYTGRDWQRQARAAEKHAGRGVESIVLDHFPASSLTAVSVDGDDLDVSDDTICALDEENGILYRTDGEVWPETRNRRVILVSYTGGPDGVPNDLLAGALEVAAWISKASGGQQSHASGGVSESLWMGALEELPTARGFIDLHVDHSRGYRG